MLSEKSSIEKDQGSRQNVNLEKNLEQVIRLVRDTRVLGKEPDLSVVPDGDVRPVPAVGKWLFMSDAFALLAAFACSGVIAWLLNEYVLLNKFQGLMNQATAGQFAIYAELGVVALLWLDAKGHYRQRLPFWETIRHILIISFAGFVIGGFIQFAVKSLSSRLWLGFSWVFFAVFLYAGRALVRHILHRQGKWQIPAVVFGGGPTAKAAVRALESEPEMGFRIVRVVPAAKLQELSKPSDWRRFMRAFDASYLFLALEGEELEQNRSALKAMVRERLPYSILPPWLGLPLCGLSSHHFMMHDVMLLHDTNRLQLPLSRLMKRTFDLVVASAGLIVLSPLFLFVFLMVRRDGGKAFYRQPRVGLNGKEFMCYKFRSMRDNAGAVLIRYLENNFHAAAEWKKFQKLKNDPRITRTGRFLRRTSIDELPQLINVVKGEMSLVGPRPFMPGQEIFYGDDFDLYKSARPGITGPWQVSGRNVLTIQQRVALEAWYVRNWSFWMDIIILMKTIPALLKKDVAY